MKKALLLAVSAIALVACAKTFDEVETTPPAIGFNTWANVMTKARTSVDTQFSNGDNFNVFGSKVLNAANSVVFNGDEVTYDGGNWTYTPPRFWDPSATSYTFYAISPAGLLPEGMTPEQKATAATTGAFTTDEITFNGTVANDVLISKKTPVTGPYGSAVHLEFQHVASLLDVKVKKSYALKDATVTVTAIALENIVYKGSFGVSDYVSTPGDNLNKPVVDLANWTAAQSNNTTTFNGAEAVVSQYGYANVQGEALNGEPNYFWQNFVVMPQSLENQQIKISYTITTSVGETITHSNKTVAFTAFDDVDNKTNNDSQVASTWNPNTHYIYTLTLDANKIVFTAEITGWETTVNGNYNMIY